jgi:hypothetical protein
MNGQRVAINMMVNGIKKARDMDSGHILIQN